MKTEYTLPNEWFFKLNSRPPIIQSDRHIWTRWIAVLGLRVVLLPVIPFIHALQEASSEQLDYIQPLHNSEDWVVFSERSSVTSGGYLGMEWVYVCDLIDKWGALSQSRYESS